MPEFMMNLRAACIKLREESAARGKEYPASKGEASKVYQENYQSRISQRPVSGSGVTRQQSPHSVINQQHLSSLINNIHNIQSINFLWKV